MQRKKNDVKVRTTLLLSLLDEHQLRFSKYKTAKELWAAILKTFGGNEATKKKKENLLKQQYGNFKAEGSETLEQTFNILQVIVSQLQFIDVKVENDDLNQKFLTSLAPEWLMHTIVWRNRNDLDTMSLDDLYNHLKVYEAEVQKKSNPNSQNMAFISSLKHNSGDEDANTACVPTASTTVPTDINQIDEDDVEEIDIKWSIALLSMRADKFWKKTGKKISIQGSDVAGFDKSKVECFNCHKMGHFARECRAPRSQERGRKDNYRQGSKAEEKTPKELMAIDGVGWDWSYMANEGGDHALVTDAEAPTEFALMANTESKRYYEEDSAETGSPRVIIYGYDGLPIQPVALPSPNYVPGPKHPPSPNYVPGPEHPPLLIEIPYVPEPEYPEYLVPSDAETPLEDQPLPTDALPTAASLGYVADSDPDEDPEEDLEDDHADYLVDGGDGDDETSDDDDNDDDTDDDDEEPFEDEEDDDEEEAQKTVGIEPPMSASMEACIAKNVAALTPSLRVPSLPLPSPPPLTTKPTDTGAPLGNRAAGIRMRAVLPSTSRRTNILEHQPCPDLESDRKRYRVEQSGYEITDTWDKIVDTLMEIAPTTLEGVNQRVTKLDTTVRHRTDEFEVRFEEAQDGQALLRA
nr:hypothetical protein [Tanacetum cinerariifolium]